MEESTRKDPSMDLKQEKKRKEGERTVKIVSVWGKQFKRVRRGARRDKAKLMTGNNKKSRGPIKIFRAYRSPLENLGCGG